ncbi:5-carboxymethyl-2-hydroxymuconate Delta-isomerase [Alteromonas facilis]|uniref:5-carboxymethyl-2-hydroxymuconate Delta-isomerase n=1 Tax=Alteromonas facilis TaxID=2048004 RepID=UPI000C28D973|nr:5-carboxymethyl-2-hydroxymuconate Delta-isomerase [Alteromonas facilis]
MPHCVVEFSSNIQPEPLIEAVFQGALSSQLFADGGSDIKVRAYPCDIHMSGGNQTSFIHVTLKILSGRTQQQKLALSETVLQSIAQTHYESCSTSVEVIDIDRSVYSKILT